MVGLAQEVGFAALEISEDRPKQRVRQLPDAAVDALVGPEAAHVEQEMSAVAALHSQADHRRQMGPAMDEVEALLAVQTLGELPHLPDVVHRRQHRRMLMIAERMPAYSGGFARGRDLGALVRSSLGLLEADQADLVPTLRKPEQIGQHLRSA